MYLPRFSTYDSKAETSWRWDIKKAGIGRPYGLGMFSVISHGQVFIVLIFWGNNPAIFRLVCHTLSLSWCRRKLSYNLDPSYQPRSTMSNTSTNTCCLRLYCLINMTRIWHSTHWHGHLPASSRATFKENKPSDQSIYCMSLKLSQRDRWTGKHPGASRREECTGTDADSCIEWPVSSCLLVGIKRSPGYK